MKELRIGSKVLMERDKGLEIMEVYYIEDKGYGKGLYVKLWGIGEMIECPVKDVGEILSSPPDSQMGDENDDDVGWKLIETPPYMVGKSARDWKVGDKGYFAMEVDDAAVDVVVCVHEVLMRPFNNSTAICGEYGLRVPGRTWEVPFSCLRPLKKGLI